MARQRPYCFLGARCLGPQSRACRFRCRAFDFWGDDRAFYFWGDAIDLICWSFGLSELAVGHGPLQRVEEHAVQPFLVFGEVGLHMLLDGDAGGAGAVIESLNGGDDARFV